MELLIGPAVALLVQYLKNKFGTSSWKTMGILLAVSLGASLIYTTLMAVGYWEMVAVVLVTAGAFYTFILQRFEK
jgi:hypothetical protein